MSELVVLITIILVNETVPEDSESLMDPESDKGLLGVEVGKVNHEHSLNNLGKISEVEGVVALSWGGEEVSDSLDVEVDGGLDDGLSNNFEAG